MYYLRGIAYLQAYVSLARYSERARRPASGSPTIHIFVIGRAPVKREHTHVRSRTDRQQLKVSAASLQNVSRLPACLPACRLCLFMRQLVAMKFAARVTERA